MLLSSWHFEYQVCIFFYINLPTVRTFVLSCFTREGRCKHKKKQVLFLQTVSNSFAHGIFFRATYLNLSTGRTFVLSCFTGEGSKHMKKKPDFSKLSNSFGHGICFRPIYLNINSCKMKCF